jgi:hypothetical protein
MIFENSGKEIQNLNFQEFSIFFDILENSML